MFGKASSGIGFSFMERNVQAYLYDIVTACRQVAYPVAADNVSGPLASRLRGVNQPVSGLNSDFQPLIEPSWPA
jgi:hypothetical protein